MPGQLSQIKWEKGSFSWPSHGLPDILASNKDKMENLPDPSKK